MRGRRDAFFLEAHGPISIFRPYMWGLQITFASGISNLAKMSVERARLLSVRRVRDWLFRELNFGEA
jgi:hypothetical protein